jgi:hypothetical protein
MRADTGQARGSEASETRQNAADGQAPTPLPRYQVLEVTVSSGSPAAGARLSNIRWPDDSIPVSVLHHRALQDPRPRPDPGHGRPDHRARPDNAPRRHRGKPATSRAARWTATVSVVGRCNAGQVVTVMVCDTTPAIEFNDGDIKGHPPHHHPAHILFRSQGGTLRRHADCDQADTDREPANPGRESMKRIALILAAALLPMGVVLAIGVPAAQAQSGYTYCGEITTVCINAWGGGPWVKVYNGDDAVNDDFTGIVNGSYIQLEDTDGGAWNNTCIGDAYNESGYADTSLDPCSSSSGAGWGTLMTAYGASVCGGSDLVAFKDKHWGGWLSPSGFSNGDLFYLNTSQPYCFFVGGGVS